MSAALIAKLVEAGTPAELIGEVAMALAKAEAAQEVLEDRRAKDRERKRSVPRNSAESEESTEIPEKVSPLQVSPQTPLPNPPSKISPLNPPKPEDRIELPDWWPHPTWAEFKAMRRKMRNVPFGPGSERRVVAKIIRLRAEGHCPEKLLSKAIERGHRSVFEDGDTLAGKGSGPKIEPTPAELRDRAEFYDRIGKRDEAAECRLKAAQLEQRAA